MKKKVKKYKLINKFLKVFIVSFFILTLIVGLFTTAYILVTNNKESNTNIVDSKNDNEDKSNETKNSEDQLSKLKKITTFAVFGVDKDGYRTDVTMLVFFNKDTMNIDIISVPRDTMIKIPDDIYSEIKQRRSDVEQVIKINEVPAYSDPSKRNETSVAVLESVFDIDIDYYASLNLEGFKSIVDLVGPIEVEVPFDLEYSDPLQDLYINIDAGVQQINGAQAEGLIRFRKGNENGYANGDIGRIETQHRFMKAFINKLLTLENKINIINIASTALLYVKTDFTDAIDYVNYIDDISTENINITILPGHSENLERSYYIYDYEETQKLLKTILSDDIKDTESIDIEDIQEEIIDAKSLVISVQNGTNINGFAGRTKAMLEEKGYNVAEAVDYKGDDVPISNTRLIVPSKLVGEEMAEFFESPEVRVDGTLIDDNIQIIIILGESDG